MKLLIIHVIKLISIVVVTIVCLSFGFLFFDMHLEKVSEDYKQYNVISTVISVTQEGFSEGVYYYKVEYMFTRDNENHIISELVKEKTTYLPREIGEEVEFYVLEDNYTIKKDFFTFYKVISIVFIALGLLGFFGGGIVVIIGIFDILKFIKCKIVNEEIEEDFFKFK
ncbi:MAG: hypothetical protein R3Y13_05685 [bacterium]